MSKEVIDFHDLMVGLELRRKINKEMTLEEVAEWFSELTGQYIQVDAIQRFKFTGLTNLDFLTSDWLIPYGVSNIYEYDTYNKNKDNDKWDA